MIIPSGNSKDRRKSKRKKVLSRINKVMNDVCGNGIYWCDHLYEEKFPWQWVDFLFLSVKNPKRYYFACTMATLQYLKLEHDESATEELLSNDPKWEQLFAEFFSKPKRVLEKGKVLYEYPELTHEQKQYMQDRQSSLQQLKNQFTSQSIEMHPSITLSNYGWRKFLNVQIDKPYITPNDIINFINEFREMGEPISEGIVWRGEGKIVT